jgi:hypothetical protein
VRLPFRHTGGVEITAFTFAKVFGGRKQTIHAPGQGISTALLLSCNGL